MPTENSDPTPVRRGRARAHKREKGQNMNNHETNPESTTATDPLADIVFSVRQIPVRTDGFMDESSRADPGRTHWEYTLQRVCHKLTGQFSQGSAHRRWKKLPGSHLRMRLNEHDMKRLNVKAGERVGQHVLAHPRTIWMDEIVAEMTEPMPPTLNGILSCLISDADGADALTFEEWCSDFGYDTDSRKAERIFNECRRIAVLLQRILPREHWNTYRDA